MPRCLQCSKGQQSSANVEYLHGALYYKGRLWSPAKDDLRKMICKVEDDSKVASHIGQDKTIEIIKHNFVWLGLDKDIKQFVCSCESCQHNKVPRYLCYGLLSPLESAYVLMAEYLHGLHSRSPKVECAHPALGYSGLLH
jgi:hypothetical protein